MTYFRQNAVTFEMHTVNTEKAFKMVLFDVVCLDLFSRINGKINRKRILLYNTGAE